MKHIKRINELFDTPELKGQFEIPYIKGEIPLRDYVKNAKLRQGDSLLGNILSNAPFVMPLQYTRKDNILALGFHKHIKDEKGDSAILFSLEIRENRDKTCIANLYSTIYKDGKIGYKNSINKGVMTYNQLMIFIRSEFLDALIEINKISKAEFNWSILNTFDKNQLRSNPRLN